MNLIKKNYAEIVCQFPISSLQSIISLHYLSDASSLGLLICFLNLCMEITYPDYKIFQYKRSKLYLIPQKQWKLDMYLRIRFCKANILENTYLCM